MSTTQNNSKQGPIVIGVILIALIIGGILWSGNKDEKEDTSAKAETTSASASAPAKSPVAKKAPSADSQKEAERMMKTASAKETEEKKAKVKVLNERLEREAKARVSAEKAAMTLKQRIAELKRALKAAEGRRKKLASAGKTDSKQYAKLTDEINRMRNQLSKLEPSYKVADTSHSNAMRQQLDTEQAIVDAGGEITLADYLILSQTYKRRHAVIWNDRLHTEEE